MSGTNDPWCEDEWYEWSDLLEVLARATGFPVELVTLAIGTDRDCSDAVDTKLHGYEQDEDEWYRLHVPLDEFKKRLKAVDARLRLEKT